MTLLDAAREQLRRRARWLPVVRSLFPVTVFSKRPVADATDAGVEASGEAMKRLRAARTRPTLRAASLLDIFTIILIFLIVSFESEDYDFRLNPITRSCPRAARARPSSRRPTSP
ncbi:MAG: hypothetical protein R3F43_27800 [bacterium]